MPTTFKYDISTFQFELLISIMEENCLNKLITINNYNKMDVFHSFKRFFTNSNVLLQKKQKFEQNKNV
jgi:hypothetical protein